MRCRYYDVLTMKALRPFNLIYTVTYTVSSTIVAFSVAWLMLYHTNFFYSVWHDVAGIGQKIEIYAPQNEHIKGFEFTTKHEREKLFHEICMAIHLQSFKEIFTTNAHAKNSTQKAALENIHFTINTSNHNTSKALLHEREITHLLDVANAIKALYCMILLNTFIWLACLVYQRTSRKALPNIKRQLYYLLLTVVVLVISILLIGPTRIFYWLHQVVFPNNHQWYFFYQDSLMSTMMAAPTLFAYIALAWLFTFILLFYFIQLVTKLIMVKQR